MSFRIFISRNKQEVLKLAEFCKNRNWQLFPKSLISFHSIPFVVKSDFDVVFFPSPRAAQFFLNENLNVDFSTKFFATAGEQTASTINKMGYGIHFFPTLSGNVIQVRQEFQNWLGSKKVLYVGSNLARKSVLTNLDEKQWSFLQVYETIFEKAKIPESDIYVFTSPSNVQSFLINNILPKNAKVIAWGSTTAEKLENLNVEVKHTLERSEEKELIDLLINSY
jgi:uroporphyrinogen-III synthase